MKAGEEFDYDSVPEHKEELLKIEHVIEEGTNKLTKTGIVIGEAFLRAKDQLGHGMFMKWCCAKTCYSTRTAETYMNLTELYRRLSPSDQEDLSELCSSAARELASPGVDEADVKEILSRVRKKERLTVEFVEDFLRRAKRETKSDTDEAALDPELLQLAARIWQALEDDLQKSLWQSLRDKPGSQDLRFTKCLRYVCAKQFRAKPREEQVHKTLAFMGETPAV